MANEPKPPPDFIGPPPPETARVKADVFIFPTPTPTPATDYMEQEVKQETPPANPLFDTVNRLTDESKNLALLLKYWKKYPPKVATPFLPYLIVRSYLGDNGQRPPTSPISFATTPDIWVAPGDPSVAPPIPPYPAYPGSIPANSVGPFTVYAHVWNLGRAPIAGVKVDFYWFANPACQSLDLLTPNPIGSARVTLPPGTSLGCHQLVKCPNALTLPSSPPSSIALVAQVSSLGDPITVPWHPEADRHVARRDFGSSPHAIVLDASFSPPTPTVDFLFLSSVAQTFTANNSGILTRIEVYIRRVTRNFDLQVDVRATSSGLPTFNNLASFVVPFDSVPTVAGFFGIDVSPAQISLTSGTLYAIVLTPKFRLFTDGEYEWVVGTAGVNAVGSFYYLRQEPPWSWLSPHGITNAAAGFRTYVCTSP